MAQFSYIDSTGKMQTVEAADSATALKSAPNIAPNSGVQLYRSVNNNPSQWSSGPTMKLPGNVDVYPGTNTPMTSPPPAGYNGPTSFQTPTNTKPTTADSILASIGAGYNSNNPLDTAKKSLVSAFTTIPNAPDQNTILEQKRAAAQAIINEINSQYSKTYSDANVANTSREARVRALTSNSGLGGSNAGSSNMEKAAEQSTKNISMIDDEKNAKINAVLSGISQQASEEYAKQRAAYLAEINGKWDQINAFQTSELNLAKQNMQTLATNGVSLSALQTKAPDTYKALLEQSGMDPVVFAAVYNSSLPENQKATYSYQKIGNDLYAIHVDPTTKKIVSEKINSPDGNSYDKFMIAPDGTPLFIDTENGKVMSAGGNYSKPKTTTTPSSSTYPAGVVTTQAKNDYDLGLNYLRRQADYKPNDEVLYRDNAAGRAQIIKAAQDEKAAGKI